MKNHAWITKGRAVRSLAQGIPAISLKYDGVKRIPRAAVIRVARAVRLKNVVGVVVQSAEAQRRSAVASFCSMVEDHVENDLDATS